MNQVLIYCMMGRWGCPLYHFFLWILRHGLAVQELCNINKFNKRNIWILESDSSYSWRLTYPLSLKMVNWCHDSFACRRRIISSQEWTLWEKFAEYSVKKAGMKVAAKLWWMFFSKVKALKYTFVFVILFVIFIILNFVILNPGKAICDLYYAD